MELNREQEIYMIGYKAGISDAINFIEKTNNDLVNFLKDLPSAIEDTITNKSNKVD